jgi:hypothetical protein
MPATRYLSVTKVGWEAVAAAFVRVAVELVGTGLAAR